MPGIIIFRRRWAFGSDDIVLPFLLLLIMHSLWLVAFVAIYDQVEFNPQHTCSVDLKNLILGHTILHSLAFLIESIAVGVSLRGGIFETQLRASMPYLLYARVVLLLGEMALVSIDTKRLVNHYTDCGPEPARIIVLVYVICKSAVALLTVVVIWCAFDSAGSKWVKIQRYQEHRKEKTRRARYSGHARRNLRQRSWMTKFIYRSMERKAFRAYEKSWDRRFKFLCCCCVQKKDGNKNSMTEIAQILSEFFRDLDVVASDVIAGLVLLRRYQKLRMVDTIQQDTNDVCRYLSGIPITPRTEFLQLGQPEVLAQYKQVIHYMKFALAAYGWPVYMMMNTCTGLCRILPDLSCCCRCCCPQKKQDYAIDDNCCECNAVVLKRLSGLSDAELISVAYHVDIDQTPFYVALDNKYKKIVISVRGTLALQDVLNDLKADPETIPTQPVKKDWVGHKGMVQAAICIRKKLKEDQILEKAFEKAKSTSSEKYDIVLVGHSLGAGTATILAILLQQEYPDLHCYAYSPPGNLLSLNCVGQTRHFITSVVVGQDVVARIGFMQMELLRTDLINVVKKSRTTKWKIILKALLWGSESSEHFTYDEIKDVMAHNVTDHPSDKRKGLSDQKPLYPPGKIIQVVKNDSGEKKSWCQSSESVYQAMWVDNCDFQEVLIAPSMLNDHMPITVMESLEKILLTDYTKLSMYLDLGIVFNPWYQVQGKGHDKEICTASTDSIDCSLSQNKEATLGDGERGTSNTQFIPLADSVA